LRDRERITYFEKPAEAGSKPAPRAALFAADAENLARKLAGIPASQLRRFYGGVRSIKRQIDLDPKLGIDFIKSELALLKAKGAYALARLNYQTEGDRDPDELLTLLVRHSNSVEDRASFNAFVRHFEAIMAYHKVFEEKRANR
jgi:CRISPR-associated protein Csm2